MAFQGASSSSSSTGRWNYDVFLSFRGEDTRKSFTAHLYTALSKKGINTFIDDDELKRGEEISPALHQAIEQSRISIVVFSQNYASSEWCLNELLKICDCKKTNGQMVLPVFYKVDPSDVRHQMNSFEGAFATHERFKDDIEMQNWKAALTQVANLSGLNLEHYRDEAQFIDKIVQYVSRIVNRTYFQVTKYPVGIESRVREINSLLSIDQMNDIHMVGILGAGGIGKTTIAKAIYNSMASQFEGSCFLGNVRENSKHESDLVKLQNTLLSKILGDTVKVDSVDEGITVIKRRLCSKKVLLILDDVDNQLVQLDKLAGQDDWFGLGSVIIITTRDRKVLTNHGVVDDLIYKVKELDGEKASELFCWNAFRRDQPTDDFLEVTKDAIHYAGGLPLALEVLGSHLRGEDIHKWRSVLEKYKRIPHEMIQKRLRISYDGLHEDEQNIFLDIACFFRGKSEDYVKTVLASSDCFPDASIPVLIQKSLITIDKYSGCLAMHDLLQDMGREVVRQESPFPGERSRLWFHKDVRDVLEDDMGTNKIQGILVDFPEGEDMVDLSSKAFEKMRGLRLLMVTCNARFSTGPNFLPNTLRELDWPNCPLECLPSNVRGENLIVLRMPHSLLKELKEIKNFQGMKIMDFSYCEFLEIFPDVSSSPNLEDLKLNGCINLAEVHHSVGLLEKLVSLSLDQCYNLSRFPRSLKLRSLKYLCVTVCSRLNYFPEIECQMECLEEIIFTDTGIKELPSSIEYLIGLKVLILERNKSLVHLPNSISQLQHLYELALPGCSKLVKFLDKMGEIRQSLPSNVSIKNSSFSNDDCSLIGFPMPHELNLNDCVLLDSSFFSTFNCFPTLSTLDLSGSAIVTIPACIERFVCLSDLILKNCKQLQKILSLPPNMKRVWAEGCMSLKTFFEEPQTSQLLNTWWLPELELVWYETTCSARGPVGSGAPSATYQNVQTMAIAHPLRGLHHENRYFDCFVSGNKIPDWFNYQKKVSNSNSCEIDIDEAVDMCGEFTISAFSALVGIDDVEKESLASHHVIITASGKKIVDGPTYCWRWESDYVWLGFDVGQYSFKLPSVDHVRIKFEVPKPLHFKGCGFHLVRLVMREKAIDLIDGIQLIKRPRDDGDGNLESNWYPEQKRRSSNAEDTLPTESTPALEFACRFPRPLNYDGDDDDGDDGDGNLESNWCPQQKRHSSNAEDAPPGDQSTPALEFDGDDDDGDDGDGNLESTWCPQQKRHSSNAEDAPPGDQFEQERHSSSSPSPPGTQSRPSLPSGNGDPRNNPSVSSEQQSNSSILSQGAILFLIASVIGLQQLDNAFRTHPANMWISQVALLLFCLSYATIPKINGTQWKEYSQIIDGFRIISGTLFTASLSSIHLPHQLRFLFYALWVAFMCVVVEYKIMKSIAAHLEQMNAHQKQMNAHREQMNTHREHMNAHGEHMNAHREVRNAHQEHWSAHQEHMNADREHMNAYRELRNAHREQMAAKDA